MSPVNRKNQEAKNAKKASALAQPNGLSSTKAVLPPHPRPMERW